MEHPLKVSTVFDLLQVRLQSHGGGSVTVTVAREDVAVGKELIAESGVDGGAWLPLTVTAVGDDFVEVARGDSSWRVSVGADATADSSPQGVEVLSLMAFSVRVWQWDVIADEYVSFVVDADQWQHADDDVRAALAVADAVEEQLPEHLDIIADYMAVAEGLGSGEARAWLADYYGQTDSKYDPYV